MKIFQYFILKSIIHCTQSYSKGEMYPLINGAGNNFLTVYYKEKYKIYNRVENPYFFKAAKFIKFYINAFTNLYKPIILCV